MFAASIQGEGVLAKSKSQSGLGKMQARFAMGVPVHGHGSCVLDLAFHWPFRVGAGPHFPRHAEWSPINKNQSSLYILTPTVEAKRHCSQLENSE